MASIVDRIGALGGTEVSKAIDLAHYTYQDRVSEHRHVGRALVETVAQVCRDHPNLVGLGAGVLVEQLLVHARDRQDAPPLDSHGGDAPTAAAPIDPFTPPADTLLPPGGPVGARTTPRPTIKLSELKPRQVALEVFGALVLLKLAATGARIFRHKHQGEVWFAPAARIRLFSSAIAVYNLVSAVRSPKISAWRNGAIFFFGTDALKPILNPSRKMRRLAAARSAALRKGQGG